MRIAPSLVLTVPLLLGVLVICSAWWRRHIADYREMYVYALISVGFCYAAMRYVDYISTNI